MFNATHHPLPLRKTMFFYDHNFSMNGKTVHNTANNFFFPDAHTHEKLQWPYMYMALWNLSCIPKLSHAHTPHLLVQCRGTGRAPSPPSALSTRPQSAGHNPSSWGRGSRQNSQCRRQCTMYYLSAINAFKLKYIRMLHNNTVPHFPEEKRAAMYYITLV